MLEGKLIDLRVMEREDVDFEVECYNEQGFWSDYLPIVEQISKSERMKSFDNQTMFGKLFVIQKKNGMRVGFIYHRTNPPYGATEIGYFLVPNERGKGYGTEAVQLMVDYLFLSKDIVRIEAGTSVRNKVSQRVLEKAGFKIEGTLRKVAFDRGVWTDHYVHSILRQEWKEPKILTKTH